MIPTTQTAALFLAVGAVLGAIGAFALCGWPGVLIAAGMVCVLMAAVMFLELAIKGR